MTPPTDYHRWAFEARRNGIPMYNFKQRLADNRFDAERAATQPIRKRSKKPDSEQALIKKTGIAEASYYRAKRLLDDIGADYTQQDVIDICLSRRQQ